MATAAAKSDSRRAVLLLQQGSPPGQRGLLGTPAEDLILACFRQNDVAALRQVCSQLKAAIATLTFERAPDTALCLINGSRLSVQTYFACFPGAQRAVLDLGLEPPPTGPTSPAAAAGGAGGAGGAGAGGGGAAPLVAPAGRSPSTLPRATREEEERSVTANDAILLRQCTDLRIERAYVTSAAILILSTRGAGQPALRKLCLKHCGGTFTGAEFVSQGMIGLRELRIERCASIRADLIAFPPTLTRLSVMLIHGLPQEALSNLRELRHLSWEVDGLTTTVDGGFDLPTACPLLEQVHVRVGGDGLPAPSIRWDLCPHLRFLSVIADRRATDSPYCVSHLPDGLEHLQLRSLRGAVFLTADGTVTFPPSMHSLEVFLSHPVHGAERLLRHLPRLKLLLWAVPTPLDGTAIDITTSWPLLQKVSIPLGMPEQAVPTVDWRRLAHLTHLCIEAGEGAVDSPGCMSLLPSTLESLEVKGGTGKLVLLEDGDMVDLLALRTLRVSQRGGLWGTLPLSLPALQEVTLHTTYDQTKGEEHPVQLEDLLFLASSPRLHSVTINRAPRLGSRIGDTGLARLGPCVKTLVLSGCPLVAENSLHGCTGLEYLSLTSCAGLTLTTLAPFPKLRSLHIVAIRGFSGAAVVAAASAAAAASRSAQSSGSSSSNSNSSGGLRKVTHVNIRYPRGPDRAARQEKEDAEVDVMRVGLRRLGWAETYDSRTATLTLEAPLRPPSAATQLLSSAVSPAPALPDIPRAGGAPQAAARPGLLQSVLFGPGSSTGSTSGGGRSSSTGSRGTGGGGSSTSGGCACM